MFSLLEKETLAASRLVVALADDCAGLEVLPCSKEYVGAGRYRCVSRGVWLEEGEEENRAGDQRARLRNARVGENALVASVHWSELFFWC